MSNLKSKRSVLFFVKSAVGGAERMTLTFAKQLNKDIFNVCVCIIEIPNNNNIRDFISGHFKVTSLKAFSGESVIKTMFSLAKIIREENPDIVFSSLFEINIRLLLLSPFFLGIRFVIRNNNYLAITSVKQRWAMRFTYPWASCLIAQTQEMKDELIQDLKISPSKIVVIHNPVDVETIDQKLSNYESFMNKEKVNYVAVGRFTHQKGQDILVKAFWQVCKSEPNSELYVVGRYDENDEFFKDVINWTVEHGVADKIHLVGFTDNPYIYMKNANCLVLPSRMEGLPNVLIESLYIGTPVAACKCIPVIERIVENGTTGYLTNTDNPEGLASAMIRAKNLGRVKSSYKSSTIEDVLVLFN